MNKKRKEQELIDNQKLTTRLQEERGTDIIRQEFADRFFLIFSLFVYPIYCAQIKKSQMLTMNKITRIFFTFDKISIIKHYFNSIFEIDLLIYYLRYKN